MDYSGFQKPFPEYRWKWGPLTLTESLNIPEVYLGCLKVLYDHQGERTNSQAVEDALLKVEQDLKGLINSSRPLRLARGKDRNLFRNSSQYWKLSGLLINTTPSIELSELGKQYASGGVTKSEFASFTVKTLNLPNTHTDTEQHVRKWESKKLSIRPLELILSIVVLLFELDPAYGFITSEELINVVIPLSGNQCTLVEIVQGLLDYRHDSSLFSNTWAANDGDNDDRIAREFLLFLHYYDFLLSRYSTSDVGSKSNHKQEFYLISEQLESIKSLIELDSSKLTSSIENPRDIPTLTKELNSTTFSDVVRERKQIEILARPNQAKFRKDVLLEGKNKCLLTGVEIVEALQACHIIPVKNNGSDEKSNGILLRADLHTLYDKGDIRIYENGLVLISEYLKKDFYYSKNLPARIMIPEYINHEAIRLRNEYRM